MLHARRFAGEEVLKQHGLILGPDPARTAKVGDAGLGADAGACKENNGPGSLYSRGKCFQVHGLVGLQCATFLPVPPVPPVSPVRPASRVQQVSPAPRAWPAAQEAVGERAGYRRLSHRTLKSFPP